MTLRLGQAAEDYLKAIYEIVGHEGRATTSQISEFLNVRPASVTGMLQKLALVDPPLVDYQKHHGAELTEVGKQVALEIIRHHRLLELFLHNTLGYSWDEVHHEADELEHVISEKFEERIAASLGDPSHDPHGDPIPTRELSLPTEDEIKLGSLQPGQCATVRRVSSSDPELLKFLGISGIVPTAKISVVDYSPHDGTLRIRVNGQAEDQVLGQRITNQVFIDKVG